MILPGKAGYQLLSRWRPFLSHPVVRTIIAGRSRSETPQGVADGLFLLSHGYIIDCVYE